MRLAIDAVDVHVMGDHARVALGGGVGRLAVPGRTMFEKMTNFERDQDWFRRFMLREPRGYPQCCVNLVVPPVDPSAAAGMIIMEQQRYYAAMSGTNVIGVATVLLETGIVPMTEPLTELKLEPPAGLIELRAHCENGRAKRVDFTNVPSFCTALDVPVDGVQVSVAFGGMTYAVVDAEPLGFDVRPHEARAMQRKALEIIAAAGEQIGFAHPLNPEINAIEGVVLYRRTGIVAPAKSEGRPDGTGIVAPAESEGRPDGTGIVAPAESEGRPDGTGIVAPTKSEGRPDGTEQGLRAAPITISGQVGRTPAGTGASATMAVLHARGEPPVSVIAGMFDNPFHCRILGETTVGDRPAIVPEIGAQGFITGRATYILMEDDPFPEGFMASDIWTLADPSSPAAALGEQER
jgi:proline racemase